MVLKLTELSTTSIQQVFTLRLDRHFKQSDPNDPNPQIIRSFNQPDADKLQLRILRGPCYQIKQKSLRMADHLVLVTGL